MSSPALHFDNNHHPQFPHLDRIQFDFDSLQTQLSLAKMNLSAPNHGLQQQDYFKSLSFAHHSVLVLDKY